MADVDAGLFTVAVFQDAAWAGKGLEALKQAAFPAEAVSILAKEAPDAASLITKGTRRRGRPHGRRLAWAGSRAWPFD